MTRSRGNCSGAVTSLEYYFAKNNPRFLTAFLVAELLRFLHVHENQHNGWYLDSQLNYCRKLRPYLSGKSKRTHCKYFIQNNTETPPERNNGNKNKMQIVIAWHMHWTLAVWNLVVSSLSFYPSEAGFYVKNPELDFLAHFTTLTTKLLFILSATHWSTISWSFEKNLTQELP